MSSVEIITHHAKTELSALRTKPGTFLNGVNSDEPFYHDVHCLLFYFGFWLIQQRNCPNSKMKDPISETKRWTNLQISSGPEQNARPTTDLLFAITYTIIWTSAGQKLQ